MDEDNHLPPGLPAAAAEIGAVSGVAAGVNDRYQFIGITGRANRERSKTTRGGRLFALPRRSAVGHEERFPPTRLVPAVGSERRRSPECAATGEMRRKRSLLKRTRAALQGKVPQPNDLCNRPQRGHVPGNFWRNIPCFGVQPPELARVLITTGRATKVFLFPGPSPGSAGTRTRTCSFSARRMRDGQHLPHIRG
jgi:hypothetical protein